MIDWIIIYDTISFAQSNSIFSLFCGLAGARRRDQTSLQRSKAHDRSRALCFSYAEGTYCGPEEELHWVQAAYFCVNSILERLTPPASGYCARLKAGNGLGLK